MRVLWFIFFFAIRLCAFSQVSANHLYRPDEDAEFALSESIAIAKTNNRHLFVQVGGNWCAPCLRFNNFITGDIEINTFLNENYLVYHLNYSRENKNLSLMEKYNNPQKLNFPVFLILDTAGRLLHTQRVMGLVNSLGYDKKKILALLNAWKPSAIGSMANKQKDIQ